MPVRNLLLLYIIKIAKWFMLYMPISYLYYLENDFGDWEYLTLHAVYSGVIALLEIPSGYIADVWGRKPALIMGTFFGMIGFGVYGISHGIWFFLLAEIVLGVGHSMLSGADSALLYDTLLEKKQEEKYIKHEGYITALGNFGEVAAALFVSVFIFSTYRTYFQLQALIAALGFIAAIFLKEPQFHNKKLSGNFKEILDIVTKTFRVDHKLRNLILFSAIIGFASLSMAWLAQPILLSLGLNEEHIGYAWAALNLLVAFGSIMATRVAQRLSYASSLLFMAIPLSLGYFFIGINISYWAAIPLVIFYIVRGTAHPILKNHINALTTSEKRATILSIRSLLIRILFLIIGPILGIVNEKISLEFGVILCGITVIIPSIILIPLLLHKENPKDKL